MRTDAVAVDRDLEFIRMPMKVRMLVEKGDSFQRSGADYALATFIPVCRTRGELSSSVLATVHEANGSRLVVTSLTRPTANQPRNAHELSVHPAGMAVDFRVPQDGKARAWLESVLLQLENRGLLDVTRERYPPHYHVAVFPAAYAKYAGQRAATEAKEAPPVVAEVTPPAATTPVVATAVATASVAPTAYGQSATLLNLIGMSELVFGAVYARRRALI